MQVQCKCDDEETERKNLCKSRLLPALLIALGLFGGGYSLGKFYYKAKTDVNFVTVKGLSEKNVKANLGIWTLRYVVTGNDLSAVQRKISQQKALILQFLNNQKITPDEINEGRIETNDIQASPYRSGNDNGARFIVTQSLTIRSGDVDKIEAALRKAGELVAQGIILDTQYNSPVAYLFTDINAVKPEMLKEATQNAALAAAEFAKSSNSKVGKIKRANQGMFSILAREERPDSSETQSIEKTIRVVSTVEYWLE